MQNPMTTATPGDAPSHVPTLHLVCGKIAAGKSTLARRLAAAPNTVLICEDEWLDQLFPGEISSLQDYVRLTARLRHVLGKHLESVLRAGASVALDFPANTPATRKWMHDLFTNAGAAHVLHFLDVPDEQCKARLRLRNAEGTHAFNTSDAEFDQITKYFVPPAAEEGFCVVREEG